MKKFISFSVTLLFCTQFLSAQNTNSSAPARPAVIQNIENNSKVVVRQDSKLDKLMNDYIGRPDVVDDAPYTGPGYRVQVFSSNSQKTAKNESYNIERKLRSEFPGYGVYRIYASPFWKVRIGDFRSAEDARKFRAELVKAFPDLSRETYTVREKKVTVR